jgi:apolipoprotein N-acyltransferase
MALMGKGLRYSFFLSFVSGILFFLGIFHWILEVPKYTLLHHAILASYLGSYFGFFGLVFNFISLRCGMTIGFFAAPFIWVSLEYIRSNLSFLALPWALLAHSQYQYPSVIQIASLTGAYSISFLIVMVNSALAALIYSFLFHPHPHPPPSKGEGEEKGFPSFKGENKGQASLSETVRRREVFSLKLKRKGTLSLVITSGILLLFALIYGHYTISQPITGQPIKLSLVQGNIEQGKKWDPRYAREIMDTYSKLTQEALKHQPDLVIWPETATPGSITLDSRLYAEISDIVRSTETPLLLGSAQYRKFEGKGPIELKYSNSAYLIHRETEIIKNQRYDKIRLFPFGEYLPYKEIIPWSLIGVSDSDNYMSGKEFTVFSLTPFRFGVTICWENLFPDLFRHFIRNGAQFMINITNEARFGETAAPYQLVSISIFRAVENRVFVIRCANTGVSCIINPYGRILDRVKDEKGKDIFVRGVMSGQVIPLESKTIYTRYGDILVWVALIGAAGFLTVAWWRSRAKRDENEALLKGP